MSGCAVKCDGRQKTNLTATLIHWFWSNIMQMSWASTNHMVQWLIVMSIAEILECLLYALGHNGNITNVFKKKILDIHDITLGHGTLSLFAPQLARVLATQSVQLQLISPEIRRCCSTLSTRTSCIPVSVYYKDSQFVTYPGSLPCLLTNLVVYLLSSRE